MHAGSAIACLWLVLESVKMVSKMNYNSNPATIMSLLCEYEMLILQEDTVDGLTILFFYLIDINAIFIYSDLIEITHVIDQYRFV